MRFKILGLLFLGAVATVSAQDTIRWTLDSCIHYALENNLTIKRQVLTSQNSEIQYKQKKYSLLPSLNATAGYNVGFGRVLDQSTYTFQNNTTQSANVGVNSQTPLFEGFAKRNSIKKSKLDYEASLADLDKTKNDISLQLANQYLQILYCQELLAVSKEQYSQTEQTVDQIQRYVTAGSKPMGTLYEIKSQLAKEAVNVIQAENNLNYATLNLVQMLDLESVNGFQVVVPQLPELLPGLLTPPNEVYEHAVTNMPQIKSSELSVKSSEYQLAIAKGAVYPTLGLGLGWGSSIAYYKGKPNISISEEFNNNSNSYLGLSLNIPIFNGHQVTTSINSAKLNMQDWQYRFAQEKLTLRKEIQQASNDALSAYKKYLASQEAVQSYKESFKYTQKRFDVEMINAVDYNLSKTNLVKAESDLLQAKYDYIFKTKILDFYKGIKITL